MGKNNLNRSFTYGILNRMQSELIFDHMKYHASVFTEIFYGINRYVCVKWLLSTKL
jgi:hypothetical protein